MACYRDDLQAAQERIAQLQSELELQQQASEAAQLPSTKRGGSLFFWLALAALMTLVVGALTQGRLRAETRIETLEHQLTEARAEAMSAREDARVALEAIRQGIAAAEKSQRQAERDDPLAPQAASNGTASNGTVREASYDPPTQVSPSAVDLGNGEAVIWADSRPAAKLVIDGEPVGSTPLMVRVTPGTHALLFSHARYGVKTQSVTVHADQTVRASVVFRP